MNWTEDDVFRLIDLIRRRPTLYDERHKSFFDQDIKHENLQELTEIMSSTLPRITISEVTNKWEEIQTKFFKAHFNMKRKKKSGSFLFLFYDKMKFMLKHIPSKHQIQSSGENQGEDEKAFEKIVGNDSKQIKLAISRYSPEPFMEQEAVNRDRRDNECNELSMNSVTAIPANSDSSPEACGNSKKQLESPIYCHKRSRKEKPLPEDSTVHEISFFSMTSPHVAVSDSILDRTEPLENECDTFSRMQGSSFDLDNSFLNEDEDLLYVKYICCKLNKLDTASKLRFKIEIEKLFNQDLP